MPQRVWTNQALGLAAAVVLLAGAPGACRAAAAKPTGPSALDLYRRSLDAGKSVSYIGRQFIMSFDDDGRSSSLVTDVTHQAPDSYRIVYRAPRGYAGQTIVQNGTDQWTYKPHANTIVHSDVPPQSLSRAAKLRALMSNYKVSRSAGPKIIAGRKTFEVIVQLKGSPTASARYWIDPYTGLTLRTERNHIDGSIAVVSYFSEIDLHPHLDPRLLTVKSLFAAHPRTIEKSAAKESTTLSAMQLGQAVGGLAVTPATIGGFQYQGTSTMASRGIETLHARYSDGLSTLSLFESVRRSSRPTVVARSRPISLGAAGTGHARRDMHYNALNWDRGRLNMTLVGDLPVTELARLAAGI